MAAKKGRKMEHEEIEKIIGAQSGKPIHEFLLNNSKTITMVVDRNGNLLFLNKKALNNLGYKDDEVIGKNFRRFLSRDSRKKAEEFIRKEFRGDPQPEEILEVVTGTGKKKYFEFSHGSTPLYEGRKIKGIILCAFDVTRRMEKEDELKLADDIRLNIIREAPFGMYVVNQKGIIEYANAAMARISGVPKSRLEGINTLTLPSYRRIGLSERIRKGLRGKPFSMGPVEYTSYYGKKRTIRKFKGIPLREDGVDKLLVVMEDITEYNEAEEELRRSGEKYRFIAENVNDIIFMQDMDSNIT
ncbi:MAG: PAS domain-containing protein, partial [Candidatus Woesearchaeota archaeon]